MSARPASANSTTPRNRNRTIIVPPTGDVTLVSLDQKVTDLGHTVTKLNETVTVLSQSVTGILTTVQTMQEFMMKRFDEIDKRFVVLETDVKQIKTDVNQLGKDVVTIRKDVVTIRKDVDGLHAYTKMESKIQEEHDTHFITRLYYRNYPDRAVKTLHTRVFYDPITNQILTDLDGFLLIHNFVIPSNSSHPPLPSLQKDDIVEYIIIESKHSLDKAKIDKKIQQMTEMSTYLAQTDDEKWLEGTKDKFKGMIRELVDETKLSVGLLDRPIYLIFASDYITHEVGQYIECISKGFTQEEDYDKITKKMFDNDPYVQPIMKQILTLSDGTLTKQMKRHLSSDTVTMADLRRVFANELRRFNKEPIAPYLVPYADLVGHFQTRIKHIGIFQFGRVDYLQELFNIKSLNQNVGTL